MSKDLVIILKLKLLHRFWHVCFLVLGFELYWLKVHLIYFVEQLEQPSDLVWLTQFGQKLLFSCLDLLSSSELVIYVLFGQIQLTEQKFEVLIHVQ